MTDVERLTAAHIESMAHVEIDVQGTAVTIDCANESSARDLATFVALLLADRVAAWRRVLDGLPSPEERAERFAATLSTKAAPKRG